MYSNNFNIKSYFSFKASPIAAKYKLYFPETAFWVAARNATQQGNALWKCDHDLMQALGKSKTRQPWVGQALAK